MVQSNVIQDNLLLQEDSNVNEINQIEGKDEFNQLTLKASHQRLNELQEEFNEMQINMDALIMEIETVSFVSIIFDFHLFSLNVSQIVWISLFIHFLSCSLNYSCNHVIR